MLKIITVVVTPFQQNARILWRRPSAGAVLVDPGGEVSRLLSHIPIGCQRIEAIVLTHAHIDHGGGVAAALRYCEEKFNFRPRFYAHRAGGELRQSIEHQAQLFGLFDEDVANVPEPDEYLDEGDRFAVSGVEAEVVFTPGHAPDHISLVLPKTEYVVDVIGTNNRVIERGRGEAPLVVAGDTLFSGSIGRTDLPGGDSNLLLASIEGKLLTLPEETRVMSGHGPDTTIRAERRSNPFLQGFGPSA